jgi:hypothetical protein
MTGRLFKHFPLARFGTFVLLGAVFLRGPRTSSSVVGRLRDDRFAGVVVNRLRDLKSPTSACRAAIATMAAWV